ncbi:hypothetical protein LTR85_002928 [Meristemomyces frigidus]|nr:hypothetical protein LTR85_002928 [Meristemomyces frigidus]
MAYSLMTETFAEYGIAMCFLILRFFARIKLVGLRGLGIGDAFAGAAMSYGNNIGLDKTTALEVPDSKIPDLVMGSKLAFLNWIWYMCFIWCLKGVLLNLYYKIGTDFGIILIPMPLLAKVRVHWTRKTLLMFMFSSGFFVMIATILRSYYSLRSITDLPIALGWADREALVATVTVCLPGIKPLFSKRAWFPDTTENSDPKALSNTGNRFSTAVGKSKGASDGSSQDPMDRYFEMTAKSTWRHHKTRGLSPGGSDEEVIISDMQGSKALEDHGDDIYVTREYRVSRETTRT